MQIPAPVAENFTDIEIFHVDKDGFVSKLWSMIDGNTLIFQTSSFSDFVLVGNALDGSGSVVDGTDTFLPDDPMTPNTEDGSDLQGGLTPSPETGENSGNLFVALLFLVAAGYVAIRFGKRAKD